MQPSAGILGRLEGVVGKDFTWCTVPYNNYLRTKICTIHCDQWQKRWTSLYAGMVAVQWKVTIPTNLYIGVSCQFFGKAWSLVNPMNSPLISDKSLGFVFWNEVILSHQSSKKNWSQGGVINYHDQLSWRCDKLSTSGCCYPWLSQPFPAQLCRAVPCAFDQLPDRFARPWDSNTRASPSRFPGPPESVVVHICTSCTCVCDVSWTYNS